MKLINISKSYGENVVFENFDFEFEEGKITAILGASGSGKTTLLNIIAGLTSYEGRIEGNRERVGYMFQDTRLLPNLTVYKNLEFILKGVLPKEEIKQKIDFFLEKVDLSNDRKKYLHELSGGMAQRVALARAFSYPSKLLLMDEPFVGLDVALKRRITEIFNRLYEEDRRTVLFVTHDIEDAVMSADRIVVLKKGGGIGLDRTLTENRAERDLSHMGELIGSVYSSI